MEMLSKNPSFLQAVIFKMAEDAYVDQVVDADMEDEIKPGGEFESRSDWIKSHINHIFDKVSENVKEFKTDVGEINRDPGVVNIALKYYKTPLGASFDVGNGSSVTRIPGGWMYLKRGTTDYAVYIPFSNEFKQLLS